jgi:hypothetical protein
VPRTIPHRYAGVAEVRLVGTRALAEAEDRSAGVWDELLVDAAVAEAVGRSAHRRYSVAGTPPATTLTKFSRWRVVQHSKAPSQ